MNYSQKITMSALFIALGILFPMAFHMAGGPGLGSLFLPMHIPVFLAGFLAGPTVGITVGIITPILSSFLTGMPPLVPTALMMAVELPIFGLVAGLLYQKYEKSTFVSLVSAMIAGRVVYGLVGAAALPLLGLDAIPVWAPVTTGIVSSWPGILIQLIIIPPIVRAAEHLPVFSTRPSRG